MAEANEAEKERMMKRILLIVNCVIQVIGTSGGPVVMRLYFIHGGNPFDISSFLQVARFPILLFPLFISYIIRRRRLIPTTTTIETKMITMKLPLFGVIAIIGVLQGLDTILYSRGLAYLPVSTTSLVIATQLAFIAIFAFLLMRQKFTAYSVNAIIMLILEAAVLALQSSGDRPVGESNKKYAMGFVMTLLAAMLIGFILPSVELVYKKTKQAVTYTLVLEIQMVLSFSATLFTIVIVLLTHDYDEEVGARFHREWMKKKQMTSRIYSDS